MEEIKIGASKLNDLLDLGLDEDRYIKTGGERNVTNKDKQLTKKNNGLDPDNIERNVNDISFNYSANTFDENKNKQNSLS